MVMVLSEATEDNHAHAAHAADQQRERTTMAGVVGHGDHVVLLHRGLALGREQATNVVGRVLESIHGVGLAADPVLVVDRGSCQSMRKEKKSCMRI